MSLEFSTVVKDDHYHANLGRGVWLMDDHRWALKVWVTQLRRQKYSLIHADYHWDCCYDFHDSKEREQELLQASPDRVAELVAEGAWISYDSFIAPAIRRGLIHTVHFYCLEGSLGDNAFDADFLVACGAKQILYPDAGTLAAAQIEGASIFDLCLDLFNRSTKPAEGDRWSDTEIAQFLCTVSPLIRAAELVTISMSFDYSGTHADTQHLTEFVVPRVLACRE